MLFFLCLFFIISIISLLIFLFMLSTIKIDVKNVVFNNGKINDDYKIKFSISFLNKINLFWITINKKKINKFLKKNKYKKFDFNKLKKKISIDKKDIKEILKIKFYIEKFNLKANVSLEDAVYTSYLVASISSLIGIVLNFISYKVKNIDYIINPIYNGRNYLSFKFDGISWVKIVHIMYVIYILFKKGRDKKYERTSNRRSYGYSYGQY